jgi:hypothetical protein
MHLEGEVQLLDTNYKPWWVLRKLSRHDDDVINFDADDAEDVHSFPAAARTYYRTPAPSPCCCLRTLWLWALAPQGRPVIRSRERHLPDPVAAPDPGPV